MNKNEYKVVFLNVSTSPRFCVLANGWMEKTVETFFRKNILETKSVS